MRIRIKQARPKYLNDVIQLAVELEAYNIAENRNYARPTTSETIDGRSSVLEELSAKFDSLQKEIKELKEGQALGSAQSRHIEMSTGSGTSKSCNYSLIPGHMRRNCRANKAHKKRQRRLDLCLIEPVEMFLMRVVIAYS